MRPLARRYVLVLAAVAVLVLLDQAAIQPLLFRMNFYAPVINVAGRQRMLSQKLAKEALAIDAADDDATRGVRRGELLKTVEQWSRAHRALLGGDREFGLPAVASSAIVAALKDLDPHFATIRAAAMAITAKEPSSTDPQGGSKPRVRVIVDNEPAYLLGMEHVVGLLQAEAQKQVAFLHGCGLTAMTLVLALLLGMHFFVLRPAMRLISGQVRQLSASEARYRSLAELLRQARDKLEERVADRTRDLSAANRAVEEEIHQRHLAEARMQRLSTELAHASRLTAMGQLAAGLAHEINHPLATITNYAGVCELLCQRELPAEHGARQAIAHVKQAALRAGGIVRRMRNFVRPDAAQTASVDLNDLVRDVAELCRPEAKRADSIIALDLTSQSTRAVADALQIQQVVINLVQNAIQAMQSCPRNQRHLRIRTSVVDSGIHVDVIDSGPGFSTHSVEDAFAPFFTTKPDGLGLGLAISRSIIEKHRGRLWAENRTACGTAVSFVLPSR